MKDKELLDMDFSEIEKRIMLQMSEKDFRAQYQQDPSSLLSPTGRNPQELPPPKCMRCLGTGWLEPIGPKSDGSYITSRRCSCSC